MISRIPITLVVMALDFCSHTWRIAPCAAPAAAMQCYNTFPTCRDFANFARTTRHYQFTSAGAPLPFSSGERPYIKDIKYMPTEIKDSLTVASRAIIEFWDEPDSDINIDPYLASRPGVQGTYWKKLLARNANYKGRIVRISEGFANESEYQERFVGTIDNIAIHKGIVKVEVVDLLKSIAKIEIPPRLNIRLAAAIPAATTIIGLSGDGVGALEASGLVRIGDEIISYSSLDVATRVLHGCTRGVHGTVAVAHNAHTKVQRTRFYAPDRGFNHLKSILLVDCALPAAHVNSAEFDRQRDDAAGAPEVDFSAIISEPENAEKLYFELVDLLNCKSWVAEDLRITIRRNLPNRPGRMYAAITDAEHVVDGSSKIDLNQKSRISRVSLYWDRAAVKKNDDPASFARLDVAIDASSESTREYGEIADKKIFCRWLRTGHAPEEAMINFARDHSSRLVGQFRDPMPLLDIEVELKDEGVRTGDYVRISTDELQDRHGRDLTLAPFQVVRREKKGGTIALKCLRITPKKYSIIAPAGFAGLSYASATLAEREYGAITDRDGLMSNGDDGYKIF